MLFTNVYKTLFKLVDKIYYVLKNENKNLKNSSEKM